MREIDPIEKKFYRLLLKQDAYYVILCPGTDEEVREIQERTPFLNYPFISSEGNGKSLAKALKVQLSEHEFMPAILEIENETLSVNTIYIGRGPGLYFHRYLFKRLIDARYHQESNGICSLRDAHEIVNLLKRRAVKCQEKRLVPPPNWINHSTCNNNDKTKLSTSINTLVKEEIQTIDEGTTTIHSSSEKRLTSSSSINDLPPELFEIIFSFFEDDISSLVKASEVSDQSLDRWEGNPEGIPYRELCKRVSKLRCLLFNITEWTSYWSPRRFFRSK
ncbi:uncharacterized protein BX663DRAFT_90291 [Cokeromyces recurvatus]|uniref:uncharacterized protein n=1 Tax=Cokeromyces recurvatus TaxID=90255 RepID=UPI00221EB70D|nr:uncharacterized protein BX663DRAFT_90291 [Cokeromyces recurvatus]KAI7901838.1 hypothetical protein BX663DRAFT_90291 [Cokeromyces recurvatus]